MQSALSTPSFKLKRRCRKYYTRADQSWPGVLTVGDHVYRCWLADTQGVGGRAAVGACVCPAYLGGGHQCDQCYLHFYSILKPNTIIIHIILSTTTAALLTTPISRVGKLARTRPCPSLLQASSAGGLLSAWQVRETVSLPSSSGPGDEEDTVTLGGTGGEAVRPCGGGPVHVPVQCEV